MAERFNRIVCGDCLDELSMLGEGVADLVFADPPFNIGYEYDVYRDSVEAKEYRRWTKKWMRACCEVLQPSGSFYVAIGDEYAPEIRIIGRQLGLHLRNWIIWYYTFGQSTRKKFARSHTHIFYFVKDIDNFYFDDGAVRVLSDRQKEYNDRRANPMGKLPDDVWTQFPRVCGTFRERRGHPCQMPESLLARIIRASCPPGGLVIDPFAGSGTTLVAAAKLGRRYFGSDVSRRYVDAAKKRIKAAVAALDLRGQPATWPEHHVEELKRLYQENEVLTNRMADNPLLLEVFTRQLNARLDDADRYGGREVVWQLEHLAKTSALPRIRAHVVETRNGRRSGNRRQASLFDQG